MKIRNYGLNSYNITINKGVPMKKILHWLDDKLEEFVIVMCLIAMTLIMGIQVFCRYVLGMSLSWSEELTRYLFIWSGFLSVSYCSKKCLSKLSNSLPCFHVVEGLYLRS